MDEIYLILDNPSDYESHPSVLGFVLTDEEANEIVSKKTVLYLAANELNDRIIEAYYSVPNPEFENQLERVKWRAGIPQAEITKEMRDERERINKLNEEINERNSIKSKEVSIKRVEASLPVLRSAPKEIQDCFEVSEQDIGLLESGLVESCPYFKQKTTKL